MLITFLALGSHGDVRPYLALGGGLQEAGFRVRLATHLHYQQLVSEHGLEFARIAGDPQAVIRQDQSRGWLESGRNPVRFMRHFMRSSKGFLDRALADAWEACQDAQALVYSSLGVAAFHIAERTGVPLISSPLQPLTRTGEFPSIYLPTNLKLGANFNRLSHRSLEQVFWQPLRRPCNQWRRRTLGLEPIRFCGPFHLLETRRIPHIYGFSPVVLPKPQDWPEWHQITGYWFLDPDPDWKPPPGLVNFLEAGPPPVYIGFGSIRGEDPDTTTGMVLEALRLAKLRAVPARGWGGLELGLMADGDYTLEAVPHSWLFPRMAAVVHHGGAGTTAQGLQAGIPSLILPFFGDQPFWGSHVAALGVGRPPIPQHRLTAGRLAAAMTEMVADEALRARAQEIGQRIKVENGVRTAVGTITEIVGQQLPQRTLSAAR